MKYTFIVAIALSMIMSCSSSMQVETETFSEEEEKIQFSIIESKETFIPADAISIVEEVPVEDHVEEIIVEEVEQPAIEIVEEYPLVEEQETAPEPQQTIVDEFIEECEETTPEEIVEEAETILEVVEEVIEKEPVVEKTVLQKVEDTIRGEGESKEAIIAGNVLPMWFVYTAAFLIFCCLYTICYISKNRRWRRIHND